MPHTCCARDGKRISSTAKKIRLTSQPCIWNAIQYFGEDVEFGKPICEGCREELRRKYTKRNVASSSTSRISVHRNQRVAQNNINTENEDRTVEQTDTVDNSNAHNSSTPLNEQMQQPINSGQQSEPQPSPSATESRRDSQKRSAESEEYIPPEAQYSQSNGSLLVLNEEFEFSSDSKQREIKYYVEEILSVPGTERKCFICPQNSRNKIPIGAIDQLVINNRIVVPFNNRCCSEHLKDGHFTEESIQRIVAISRKGAFLTPKELGDLFNRIADKADRHRIDFDSNVISDNEYKILTGISKDNFKTLHDEFIIKSNTLKNSKNRSTRNALAIFLAKLRLGVAHEFLGFLFGMDKRRISDAITSVTSALEEHFVPKYLGHPHITREDIKAHTPDLVNELYKIDEDNIALILDGTYIYIQKSQDHQTQCQTFSMHKHRNLVKAMMVVLPDGYIVEAEAMYKSNAKNNDASILRHMFEDPEGIRSFVKTGDHLILDRGFRDIIEYLAQQGINIHMPHFLDLKAKQKQFTPKQANESRTVTMIRWVVEAVNGRIKQMFQFFDKEVHNTYLQFGDSENKTCKLRSFFRIACALINAFSPPLSVNKDWHRMLLDKVDERMNLNNELRNAIEAKQINLSYLKWSKVGSDSLTEFPVLSENDIFEITLGVYQINNAKFYAKRHLEEDPSFQLYFYKENDSIIRAKIHSRFHNGQHHLLWIKLDNTAEGRARIPYYYCKCKVGARDVGCCSHITVVIWYLGYWRHTGKTIHRMSFSSVLLDAAKTNIGMPEDVAE
ncbi:unnamed protein product [Orchesella dallaii]|uniref:DDE Tnp4 domain-containing protein n=1 Tax=Orchesella dallaii TaxID=48710 RepID=A0ABP1PZP8_9HEXA